MSENIELKLSNAERLLKKSGGIFGCIASFIEGRSKLTHVDIENDYLKLEGYHTNYDSQINKLKMKYQK